MIRTLLTTTALTVLLTAGAIAQDATPAAPAPAPATVDSTVNGTVDAVNNAADAAADAVKDAANATGDAAKDAAATANDTLTDVTKPEPWDISAGYTAADTDNLATRLIGQSVFSSTGDDAEDIGKVTDLVFDENGQLTAAIIGVGGFLGIGEKSVAVDFQSLEFTVAADNTERWVLPTTKDALTAAPEFVWQKDEPADASTPPAHTNAPATPAVPAQ
jgi:hypothetical protein